MAAFNLENLPVTELYLVDSVASTGTGQTVTVSWRDGDTGPFRQVDNTPANDVFLTEIPLTLSARLGATKMEGTFLTGGTERWTTEGVREASYVLAVRGVPNTETDNPPTTSLSRNYRAHLTDALCVCGETWLIRNLQGVFSGATTDETVTAGEEINTTAAGLGVSLHTDNKYYKHSATYTNLQGVIEKGQTIAADGSFTLKNLKGSSIDHTGLTEGALYYVGDAGVLTTTFSSTVAFIGKAKNATQLDHALQFNASASSDAEIIAGTDTNPKLQSAAQIKLGAQTHAGVSASVVYPQSVAGTAGAISNTTLGTDTTANYFLTTIPAAISANKLTFRTGTATVNSGVYNFGLYSGDGQTKFFEETVSIGATTNVVVTETFSTERVIAAGIYYLVFINTLTNSNNVYGIDVPLSSINQVSGEAVIVGTSTEVSGTLPTTFDPTALTVSTGRVPILRLDN